MNDIEFKQLLDRQIVLLNAVKEQGLLAVLRHKNEMEQGARAVIAESYRRLENNGIHNPANLNSSHEK